MPQERDEAKPFYWYLSIALALIAYAFGIAAYVFTDGWSPRTFYQAAQVLLLNAVPVENPMGEDDYLLEVAQVATSLALLVAGIATAILVWKRVRTRVGLFMCGHTVVTGKGETARSILAQLEDKKLVAQLEDLPRHWKPLTRATQLIAAGYDDGQNVAAAAMASKANRESRGKAEIFAHISNARLRAVLRRDRTFRSQNGEPRVTIFNRYEHVARALLRRFPLDYVRISPDDHRSVHLVVLGFDEFGEAIAVRAALQGVFANLIHPVMTIVDPQAQQKGEEFLKRYPQWGRVVRCTFLSGDPTSTDLQHEIATRISLGQDALTTVVVALRDDTVALPVASDLLQVMGRPIPIRVVPYTSSGIARMEGGEDWPKDIAIFGEVQAAAYGKSWKDEELDRLARIVHEDHVRNVPEEKKRNPANRGVLPWELLDDDLVDSNRQQADHIPAKLRALGVRAVPLAEGSGRTVDQFSEAEVEALAKMEHRRWMAERFLAGWTLGDKDIEARRSPYLVEWEGLDFEPEIRDYDRNTVRLIPTLMERSGKALVR